MNSQATIDFGHLGGIDALDLSGLWARYKDPEPILEEISHLSEKGSIARLQRIYSKPIQPRLITEHLTRIRDAGIVVAGKLSLQLAQKYQRYIVDAGIDLFIIRGFIVSAEHVSSRHEPFDLRRFVYELDVPVIVGEVCTDTAALHFMRTGVADVLVGFGGGAAHSTRQFLGVHTPMAATIADVAAVRCDYMDESGGRYVHVIVGGRVGRPEDLARAIVCGAGTVMLGATLVRVREAPGQGWHWGSEVAHPDMPRGQGVHVGTSGTLEQILYGPSTRADGLLSFVDALERTMASTGYAEVRDLQEVEVVVSPYRPSETR